MTVTTTHAPTAGYALSSHALTQMADRGIDPSDVTDCLLYGNCSSTEGFGKRSFWDEYIGVYVDERKLLVLAVLNANELEEIRKRTQRADPTISMKRFKPAPIVQPRRTRDNRPEIRSGPLQATHVLDGVHPALRDEVTRQVAGDFTRLVVHSPTKVSIEPPKS